MQAKKVSKNKWLYYGKLHLEEKERKIKKQTTN